MKAVCHFERTGRALADSCPTRLRLLLLLLPILAASCGEEASKEAPPGGLEVDVVEVFERNHDTFDAPFAHVDRVLRDVPVRFEERRVLIDPEAAVTVDPAALARYRLTLSDPQVPLGRCLTLVVHTISFEGVGRESTIRRYHAFAGRSGVLDLPRAPVSYGASFEYDPAASAASFLGALKAIRLVGGGPLRVGAAGDGPGLEVVFGERSLRLAEGETAQLSEETRRITVKEMALNADSVEFVDSLEEVPDPVVEPPRSHGEVEFRGGALRWRGGS